MLPLGTIIRSLAPGHWIVARTPDSQPAVIATFAESSDADVVWSQLDRWCAELHAKSGPGLAVPVRLRLPDATPRLAYAMIPWRVGGDGLSSVPASSEVIQVLKGVATTLDALHSQGITHGALGLPSLWWESPGNVLLPDVGLAHVLDGLIELPPNAAAYHAPEIWRGSSSTPASDQFALAVVALEMLSGRERNPVADVEGLAAFEPIVLEAHTGLFTGPALGMYDVFQRALAASPSARFSSCSEFVEALAEALAGHTTPTASLRTVHPVLRRFRPRVTARGVGFTALAASVLATAFFVGRRPFSTSRIAESVTERLQDLSQVETIMPDQQSRSSDLRSSRSNLQRDVTGRQSAPGTRNALSTAPTGERSPSAIPSNDDAVSAGSARGNSGTAPRSVDRAAVSLQVPVAALADSLRARALESVAVPGRGERFALAMTEAVRTASGAGRTVLSPEEARASEALRRSGVIRLDIPRGSRVYLDGVLQAGTPTSLTAIAGPHDIDVLLPGATQPQRRRVTIVAADTTVLRIPGSD